MMGREMPLWSGRTRRWWPGRDRLAIHAYPGFGTAVRLWVRGRVLDDEGLQPASPGSSAWRNLRDAWRRFETDERPGLRVRAMFQGRAQEAVTDEEGFFELVIEPAPAPPADRPWHEVELSVLDGHGRRTAATATARVFVPSARARLAVISDIDDTIKVLASGSTLVLAEDTVAAARHAAAQGWIDAARLPAIVSGKEADEPPAKAASVEETVVIAPAGPAAARAALESGVVEAALEQPAPGEKTPAVVVQAPDAPPPGGPGTGGAGSGLL